MKYVRYFFILNFFCFASVYSQELINNLKSFSANLEDLSTLLTSKKVMQNQKEIPVFFYPANTKNIFINLKKLIGDFKIQEFELGKVKKIPSGDKAIIVINYTGRFDMMLPAEEIKSVLEHIKNPIFIVLVGSMDPKSNDFPSNMGEIIAKKTGKEGEHFKVLGFWYNLKLNILAVKGSKFQENTDYEKNIKALQHYIFG